MNASTRPVRAAQIAIVGAACRLPGGVLDLDGLWRVLVQGMDVIGQAPADRFDRDRFVDTAVTRPGKSYTAAGGFLDDVASFDAEYFGITPKEASRMDPQHRILLELAVEALDDAALPARALAGSDTAVYVGISDASYAALQMMRHRSVNAYTMAGGASSLAANRLSHFLDLRGPSMAIDTACSSSLVALDRACRTLQEGTSRTVLAAGANILLSPYHYVGFCQAGMLSRRGRCAAFSANADGFVRSEGGGLVVLKRLEDALADGDRVHGVIVGTGSNSDGRTPGVSLPNPQAQEDLLRSVYARAGADPEDLVYFEAHGTGTLVGDPAECRAIGQALGAARSTPLPIGTVKSNLGHLEPASGMAGLLKALLVLRHGLAPATLHTQPANPDIDFTALSLAPVTRATPLEPVDRPLVGVNSFGFGGANAHAILTTAPPARRPAGRHEPAPRPVTVSARSPQALTEAAARMSERLRTADPADFYDLAYTASRRRELHRHRAVVLASDPREAAERLLALSTPEKTDAERAASQPPGAEPAEAVGVGTAVERGRVAFVFSGNGSQWAGMGADLLADDPAFRDAVQEVDAALRPHLGWSVTERLSDVTPERMAATEVAQPLLFALQVALSTVLRRQGVTPAAVLGHSVGEVAAAHVAGALTLRQAARVIAERSRAQAPTAGSGRMAALALPPDRAAALLADHPEVTLAAVNSERDVTVAGPADRILRLAADMTARNTACTVLDLDYAFHSAAMDPLRRPLCHALRGLTPARTRIALFSTVSGERARGPELGADHWWNNVRAPVQFAPALEAAIEYGADVLVEIGPHPVLRSYLRRAAARQRTAVAVVPTLRREAHGTTALRQTVEAVLAAGADLDPNRYFPVPGRVMDLPAYPWQRKRHWQGAAQDWVRTSGSGLLDHPLLGERMPGPHPVWHGAIEPALVPWLVDHKIGGSVVMPATGYVEMILAAGQLALKTPVEVDHLRISAPLVVPWADATGIHTQTAINPDDGTVTVTSTDQHSREPRPHLRARVRSRPGTAPDHLDVPRLRARCPGRLAAADHYTALDRVGLGYGPAFRVLTGLNAGEREVLAHYDHGGEASRFTVHPALLDGALQAGVPLLTHALSDGRTGYLPAAIDLVQVWRTPSRRGIVHVRERSFTAAEACWDITVADEDGTVSVELRGCRMRRLSHIEQTPVLRQHTELRAAPLPGSPPPAAGGLPTATRLAAACAGPIAELCRAAAPLRIGAALEQLDKAYVHYLAEEAVTYLTEPTAPFTVEDLVRGGLRPQFAARFAHALSMKEWRDLAEPAGPGAWRLTTAPRARALYQETARHFPRSSSELVMAARNCEHGAAVHRGETDGLELLTGEGAVHALEQFYDIAPTGRTYNHIARELVRELVRHWPADRPLRVLEVGAGTGGMTSALLPLLPADRTTYLFTDLSAAFLPRAQQRFAPYDFVRYGVYDLDAEPAGQGLAEGGFDLVVAANALHTSTDLAAAVRRIATLLAPGGHLLAYEAHRTETLAPFFGTLDSFWHHRTDHRLRPDSALLPSTAWPELLTQCGFVDVVQENGPVEGVLSVLLATAPGTPRPAAAGPAPEDGQAAPCTVVLGTEAPDEDPLAAAVAADLTGSGPYTVRRIPAGEDAAGWTRELDTARGEVHLVLLLADTGTDGPRELTCRAAHRAALLRAMAQAAGQVPADPAHLWLITRPSGALPAPERPTAPADAAAWGVARTVATEFPAVRVRRVSLERSREPGADARRLADELRARTEETEVVLTAGGRFVPRVLPLPAATGRTPAYALGVHSPGLSYTLRWEEYEPAAPGPDEITVAVRAAALNYRDIMTATGLLPPEAQRHTASRVPGLECAGVVTAVGDRVSGLEAGDRVCGMAVGALASHVTGPALMFHRIPQGMTFEAAATMPVAFSTVHYGLETLARLRAGETVLVHGGAGGVGLAVLQFAALRGAHVIATAGSEAKRDLLRRLGTRHVLDSRSLDFAPQIMRLTQGRGVDVVVNSLAGEAVGRSMELLRPGGRFIELGKRDILENNPLSLGPFDNNLAFFSVDLTALVQQPETALALGREVSRHLENGDYRPLLHCVYPATRVREAFELMQHSRHVGKVVVAFDPLDEPPAVVTTPRDPAVDPEGTYLITGGLSGFGAATARWLADRGARHLALVSRRGPHAPEASALLEELAQRGVQAHAHAVDAADEVAMRALLDGIDASGYRLRGVVHCAMQLDDAPLAELTPERFTAVLVPKARGAAVLDRLHPPPRAVRAGSRCRLRAMPPTRLSPRRHC
ncbi:Type I polyketide synthase OS=Streptomyces fumanus OX=67302 GN=wcbR PE=4 SV=1 [Streptomyces fumanus]